MQHRPWGSHFAIGRDIVCGSHNGKWVVALVSAHTGDYFYDYTPLEYKDGVLTLSDQELFSDYWIGPRVYRLTQREALSLSSGVEAPNAKFELSLGKLLEMATAPVVSKV